jgi:hypothetical protein
VILTVSERTASALLCEAHTLIRTLPLTLSALRAGTVSWQHARIMVDETANLDRAGAGHGGHRRLRHALGCVAEPQTRAPNPELQR